MAKIKNNTLKPIDAPVFGYWKALYLSFYSKRLYVDVGKRWQGLGIRYLALLIVLWSIPFSLKLAYDLNEAFTQQLIEPLSIIPALYIQNGEIQFDKPMPYIIKNKKSEVVLIVDTTGKVNDFSPKYPYLSVLITKNKVAFRMPSLNYGLGGGAEKNPNKAVAQSFDKEDNMVFDGKKIIEQDSITKWKYSAQLIIYPIVVSLFFSMFLVLFLVLGFLGQLFTRIFFSFHITVRQGCKLLMVAATPMMLVLFILLAFGLTFPGYGFMLIGVLTVYFCLAVLALKSESKQVVIA